MKGDKTMEAVERPGYYAVIPADVRYDDRIPANAKLLYGEISALIGAKGFCYASNGYFEQLYGLSERTVRGLISKLQEAGYVAVELERDAHTGQVVKRRIWLKESMLSEQPPANFCPTPGKNLPHPGAKIFQDTLLETNTSITDKEKINKKEKTKKNSSPGEPPQTADFDPLGQMVTWIRERFGQTGDRDGMNALYLALARFVENREALKKPMKTKGAVTGLCNRLSRLCGSDMERMVCLLDDATCNGWQSVYDRSGQTETPPPGEQRREREWL